MTNYRAKFISLKAPDGTPFEKPLTVSFAARRPQFSSASAVMANKAKADAFCYIAANGIEHWIAPKVIANEVMPHMAEQATLTTPDLEPHKWRLLCNQLVLQADNTALSLLLTLIEAGVPCVSEGIAAHILGTGEHRSTIADLAYGRDMSSIKALARVHRAKGDKEPTVIPTWIPHTHLVKSWFGFSDVDHAMSVKMAFPQATLIEL